MANNFQSLNELLCKKNLLHPEEPSDWCSLQHLSFVNSCLPHDAAINHKCYDALVGFTADWTHCKYRFKQLLWNVTFFFFQLSLQRHVLQQPASAFSHTLLLSISRVKELPLGRFKTTLFPFGFNALHQFLCHLLCSSLPPTCLCDPKYPCPDSWLGHAVAARSQHFHADLFIKAQQSPLKEMKSLTWGKTKPHTHAQKTRSSLLL